VFFENLKTTKAATKTPTTIIKGNIPAKMKIRVSSAKTVSAMSTINKEGNAKK
jgi:hypothetical protein